MDALEEETFRRNGFVVVRRVVSAAGIEEILGHLPDVTERAGIRNATDSPVVCALATSQRIADLATAALGGRGFITRAILFDKTPGANWAVPWHQDTTIAVKARVDVRGFGAWTVKDGVTHCHPPHSVMAGMATLRVHLDDCGPENGPLRVIPGSHERGWIRSTEVPRIVEDFGFVECDCAAGDVVVFRPPLLHSSQQSSRPSHRRVLHLEWAAFDLPGGLEWHQRICPTGRCD